MIYVDAIGQWRGAAKSERAREVFGGGSCHLVTDGSLDELHAFAFRIGLKREWFQEPPAASHPHYDLTPSRRLAAVECGAKEVDSRELVRIIRDWRERNRQRPRGVEGELKPLPKAHRQCGSRFCRKSALRGSAFCEDHGEESQPLKSSGRKS